MLTYQDAESCPWRLHRWPNSTVKISRASVSRLFNDQGFGCHCVLGLGRSDPPGEGAQRADCAGMTVRTHQGDAREGDALLRRNYVHDALSIVTEIEDVNACFVRGFARGFDERRAAGNPGFISPPGKGIDDVVHRAKHLFRISDPATRCLQSFQCNAAGSFVKEYPVYI